MLRTSAFLLAALLVSPAAAESPAVGERARTRARLDAIEELGATGSWRDVRRLVELASAVEDISGAALKRKFTGSLDALLLSDPRAYQVLSVALERAHPTLLALIVRSVGRHPSHEALDCLSNALGADPRVETQALLEIANMAPELPGRIAEDVRARVRPYLAHADPLRVVAAVRACAAVDDTRCIPSLIALLGAQGAAATGAHEALRKLTGQTIGAGQARWGAWYDKELRWWQDEAPGLRSRIEHGTPGEVSTLLIELSGRRLFRHDLVEPVQAALSRDEDPLVLLGCAALGHLGSAAAVPALTVCLGDPNPDVRFASERALRSITGLDLGTDPAVWKRALGD